MPIYEYECPSGHVTEKFAVVVERDQTVHCKECLKITKRIISVSNVQDSSPVWLDDGVRRVLQRLDVPGTIPITTREQLKKHCKEKNVVCIG